MATPKTMTQHELLNANIMLQRPDQMFMEAFLFPVFLGYSLVTGAMYSDFLL